MEHSSLFILLISDPAAFFLIVVGLPVTAVFSIPALLIWTHHKRTMEELRLRNKNAIGETIKAEFASVRAEIQALRDTSTQYDLSFDTSLQRLERRIEQIECQPRPYVAPSTPPTQEQPNTLFGGRG